MPALLVAPEVEPGQRRKAAADSRESQRFPGIRNRFGHDAVRAVGKLLDTPKLFRRTGERRESHQLGVFGRSQRPICCIAQGAARAKPTKSSRVAR